MGYLGIQSEYIDGSSKQKWRNHGDFIKFTWI